MSSMKNNNAALLRSLLTSWDLEELYEHLRDEGISIQELEMMKPHHMNELLRNFKLGVRIRFEYHFEKWRHSIFKPTSSKYQHIRTYEPISEIEPQNSLSPSRDEIISDQLPQSQPQSQEFESRTSELHHQAVGDESLEPRIPISKLKRKHTESDDSAESQVDVLQILKSFGHQGALLLKAYNMSKCFKPAERHLLITCLVEYFVINNRHMSLNTSYILENQILKYFPTEKLENYRTDKRGKIYSKFGNMKRKNKGPTEPNFPNFTFKNEIDVETDDANEHDFSSTSMKVECVIDEQESTSN